MVSILILGLIQKVLQRSPPRFHGSSRAEMTGAINKHCARASVGPDPLRPYDISRRGRCCTGGAGAGTVIGRGGSRLVSHPPPVGGIGPSRSSASTTTSGQALSWLTVCDCDCEGYVTGYCASAEFVRIFIFWFLWVLLRSFPTFLP